MKYPEFKWVECAYNGAQNRGHITTADNLKIPDKAVDYYRTIFRYPDSFKTHYDLNKTVRGYRGLVYADFFPMDIDSDDLGKAHQDIKLLLNNLLSHYEIDLDTLWIYFSGSKGFHVLIPAQYIDYQPSDEMPLIFREMAKELGEGLNYDTTIYDWVRIFRMTNTINSKSGLYKIPLSAGETLGLSIDEIKTLAQAPRNIKTKSIKKTNEYLRTLYCECQKRIKKPPKQEAQEKIIPPKYAKLCYYNIMDGVEAGNRDNACLRLAVHWLKEFPSDMVKNMLLSWNQRNSPPMDERQVEKVFNSALTGRYDFGCNDPILSEYCDPKCKFKGKEEQEKITADKVYTIDEARMKYEEYIKRLRERKIVIGFNKLDGYMRGIAPGEVCEIIARTGVGKTAFLLNVIKNIIVTQKVPILFFSLEQPLAQIYERIVQISSDESGARVEAGFCTYDKRASETLHDLAKRHYGYLYVVDEDMLTYEELKEYIEVAARDKIGKMPSLVCIDYLGRMKGGRGTPYEITSELARLMKKLAKDMDLAIIYLHQTSRMGKTGAEEITLDMSRDSGVCEEGADFILGMWRPDLNKEEAQHNDEEELVVALLKNRKGRTGRASYKFRKPSLQISNEEFEDLKN